MVIFGVGISTVGWKMPLFIIQYFAILLPFAMSMVAVVDSGRQLPAVHWNASNPMFMISNTDHIINVNIFDSIDIICPEYPIGSDPATWEYYVVYMVNKTEYDRCTVFNPKKVLFILNCSNPTNNPPYIYTLLIRSFQSIPSNPDFVRGQSYYLISTSGGSVHEMPNQFLGACKDRNMKLMLNVCCSTNTTNQGTSKPITNWPPTQQPRRTTTRPTTTSRKTTTPVKTTQKIYNPETDPEKKPKDNLIDENVIHANGPKNVGLISDNGSSSFATSQSVFLVTFIVTLALLWCR